MEWVAGWRGIRNRLRYLKVSISIPYFEAWLFPILTPHANTCEHHLKETAMSQKNDQDNHANQLNPNNDAYWESRGYDERPEDWDDRI
jgi:hypothetical protein